MNLRKIITSLIIVSIIVSVTINDEPEVASVDFTNGGLIIMFSHGVEALNLTSRSIIFRYIQNNPGAHLRKISSALSISIGSTQYHLYKLVDGELLEIEKDSKYKRYFVARRFSELEKRILALLNRPTTRRIIFKIQGDGGIYHQELASTLNITSQAVTWQAKLLRSQGIIDTHVNIDGTKYTITNEVKHILNQCLNETQGFAFAL